MSGKILGFRDPHAALKDIILTQGYDEQLDQPMFDAVDRLERDVALLIWDTIQEKRDIEGRLNLDELREFILSHRESYQDQTLPLKYLH